MVNGTSNTFPGLSGWTWVGVPDDIASKIQKSVPAGVFRFTPITAKVGKTEWRTSLLPLGEGKFFIALKAKVRKAENIFPGDKVSIEVRV